MLPSREQLQERVNALPRPPVAIEAMWDGDTDGWYVCLTAVLKTDTGHEGSHLLLLQDGGDIRLFNGQVPPWGEAVRAQQFGEEVASKFGAPFYFPSPKQPETDCPHWWERDSGSPCRRCGVLLLQNDDPCPWRGVCYFCHLQEEREKKEASWTSEERAGPRCYICGNPAKGKMGESHACLTCLERYKNYRCSRCGSTVRILKTEHHSEICSGCGRRARLESLSPDFKDEIRAAFARGGKIPAMRLLRERLEMGLYDAMDIVHELCGS